MSLPNDEKSEANPMNQFMISTHPIPDGNDIHDFIIAYGLKICFSDGYY